MSGQQFAAQLRDTIQEIKSNGTAAIYCDNLIAYLDDVAKSPTEELSEIDLEKYKADLQLHIEQNKNYHSSQLEMFRSIVSSGQNAIRSSFLLNGGASVALLAFIGHLAAINPDKINVFAYPLVLFVIGVLAMTMTSGFTYLSQWLYGSDNLKSQSWGFGFNILCIVLGISSYLFFIWGMWHAYHAFTSFV